VAHALEEAGARPDVIFGALALRPDGAGVSTYIRELLGELAGLTSARLGAVVGQDAAAELPPAVTAYPRPAAHGVKRTLQGLQSAPPAALFHGLDVDLPLRRGGPRVATVHDLAVFDVPSAFRRHRVIGEQLIVGRALRSADVIIAVSAFTAERARHRFKRDAVVIGEAPSRDMRPAPAAAIDAARARYRLPDRFVLHVGTIEPRKNVGAIAEACRELSVPLVLAGGLGWKTTPPPGAQLLGYVPGADLPALYGAATVAAYASMYEGFGIPPVDALACGCAVVSTPVPSVELVPAGVRVSRDAAPEELARALKDVLHDEDLRAELVRAGRLQLAELSWAKAAGQVLSVYRGLGLDLPGPDAG
jgi:glycosyltransferase involved in cell wall biosynthesis